jgi:hypothetical protein
MADKRTITLGEFRAETSNLPDEMPVLINIGTRNYAVDCVITGSGNLYLECSSVKFGRPVKYTTAEARDEAMREQNKRKNENRRKKAAGK